ncbi:MazG family protein [Pseudofrankia asymbiotica]|uniref:Nucleoside triphosphate pyrophosphohydrolase n=1 Tax=Pseudofrankia asymbiotica TaxID=1834516 RepID=A0A1V2IKC9_9ACTN|nr:MazG family protein [Pseudofrankia asymbiotica]ONH33664.1 nucleoside triphosphate pyrophosphohydrolase [Pseudofrankia asymbiotica]
MTGPGPARVTLLATSARVAPGLLTAEAWDLVRRAPVLCADPAHPQLAALRAAGVDVEALAPPEPSDRAEGAGWALARLRAAAAAAGTDEVVWLLEPAAGWPGPAAALDAALRAGAGGGPEAVRVVAGTHDVPGGVLLDAVAVMDRLRSPGGCPWDAKQTHASLAPYLLEEAYEAYQAIEDAQPAELREELGDVLMQVLFHARVAQEAADGDVDQGGGRFDVDEVAAGLVDKLVRRHPHVFGDVTVAGADEVVTNWDAIKTAEKSRRSVTDGVPLTQPALSLAAKLQSRARKLGVPADLFLPAAPWAETDATTVGDVASEGLPVADGPGVPAEAVAAIAAEPELDERGIGDLLFAAVTLAEAAGVDPEAALRARARAFRDALALAEESAHADAVDPVAQDSADWRLRWPPRTS